MSAPVSLNRTVPTAVVTREAAAALVDAALAVALEQGFEAAVAVTDTSGALRAFERSDGAPYLTAEIAINKAWTAATSGRATHVWNAILADPKAAPLGKTSRLLAVSGGYPLLDGGHLVGGIGVSGGSAEQDETSAKDALRAVGFKLPD
jgi:uncharacterized protein GlcG (DUF336 family)